MGGERERAETAGETQRGRDRAGERKVGESFPSSAMFVRVALV